MHKEHRGMHSQEQAEGGAGAASTGLWGDTASSTGSSSQCEEGTGTSIFSSTLKQAVIILHLAQTFFDNYFLQIYLCRSIFLQEQKKKKGNKRQMDGLQNIKQVCFDLQQVCSLSDSEKIWFSQHYFFPLDLQILCLWDPRHSANHLDSPNVQL